MVISLLLGALPFLYFWGYRLYLGVVHQYRYAEYGYDRPFTTWEFLGWTAEGLWPGLLIGGPVLFASALAWKWPLAGAIVLGLLSVPWIYGPLASYDIADWAASIGVVYLAVALLYLAIWYLERKQATRAW